MRKMTLRGQPVTISHKQLKVGDKAPDFKLVDSQMTNKTLSDFTGVKVLNVFPSIDTSVCNLQATHFIRELKDLKVQLLNISVDLPFALGRWCNAAGYKDAIALSDYYDNNFGKSYGVLIDEVRILARSLFILDHSNIIVYLQTVDELSDSLNFDAAMQAIKSAI